MGVFLSYVSAQRRVAEELARELEALGKKTWYAPRDIPPGTIWDEQISRAISECDQFLLLFSARSDHSPHVKRELALADKYHKSIFWVRTDNTQPELLAYYLTDTQWVDWEGNAKGVAATLVAAMSGEATVIQVAQRKASRRNLLIGAGALSAAAAAGGVWFGLSRTGAAPSSSPAAALEPAPTESTARGRADRVAPSIKLSVSPSDVVSGGGFIYVTGRESGLVERIDVATRKRVVPPLKPANTVHGAAFDSATGFLWVAEFNTKAISIYDGEKSALIKRLTHVGGGQGPFRLAVDPEGQRAYVACTGHDVHTISVIRTNDYKRLPALKVGGNPAGMAVDPKTHNVLVTSRDDDLVSIVDPSTGGKRDIRVGRHPFRCAVDANDRLGYVANSEEKFISVVDLDGAKEVDRITVGVHPVGIALDLVSGVAYVSNAGVPDDANRRAGSVTMISLKDYKEKMTFIAGIGTTGIAVDANGVVYAANQKDRNLTVISPS